MSKVGQTRLTKTRWSTPRETVASGTASKHSCSILRLIVNLFHLVSGLFQSRSELAVENLALHPYYRVNRTHLGLRKDSPLSRPLKKQGSHWSNPYI